jgi:thiol-disulfide isomerase/thioredoxin
VKLRLWIAAIGLLLIAACSSSAGDPAPTIPPIESETLPTAEPIGRFLAAGSPAPSFTLKTLDGGRVSLSDYTGRPVFINFWATWCGPCKAEIPSLVELQEKYADDLVVLGFSVDDPAEKMKPYAEEYKVNYPLLVGNGREDVQNAFGPLLGIPVSVIIDREGIIAKKHTGIATKEQFEREIQALL